MNINNKLFDFIKKCPSAYQTVETLRNVLLSKGFVEIFEESCEPLDSDGKYFVVKNGTSLIAFVNRKAQSGFMICASHSDSPSFRLKLTPETKGAYTRLEVEKYGGMIYYSWLDRPLSIAGRVIIKTESGLRTALVNIDRDIAVIPSVAIHMNRGVNDGYKFNPATDMLPLTATAGEYGITENEIADTLGVSKESIVSHDLFLYNREEGRSVGASGEFILAPRLDDLECVFASLEAFLAADTASSVPVFAVFDNEEVGSETKQGAASTFLFDTLTRIIPEPVKYRAALASSMMVSADNAHAKHPNHPELCDPDNAPLLNGGIVIKWNANQRYATDGLSDAVFRTICERAGAKYRLYYNRADMAGGGTLGSIADTRVSIPTVDIGLPQLAMHSASETAGALDLAEMIKALTAFYSTSIEKRGNDYKF